MEKKKMLAPRMYAVAVACVFAFALRTGAADMHSTVNYDETKVAPYTLEDPLTFADGTKLKSASEWPKRRAEILGIFAKEMYGAEPPKPEAVVTEQIESSTTLASLAVREQVRMWSAEIGMPMVLAEARNCVAMVSRSCSKRAWARASKPMNSRASETSTPITMW